MTNALMTLISEYKEKLPFVKPAPIEQEETAKQKKQKQGQKKQEKKKDASGDAAVADDVQKMKIDN